MRCVLIEPGSCRAQSKTILDKHGSRSSDMAAVDRPSETQGDVLRSDDVCDERAASASAFAPAPASPSPPRNTTRDDSPKPQLENPDTSPAHDIVVPIRAPTSQGDVMEKDIQECYPPLPSLDCQDDDFQPHRGTQSPSALRGTSPSVHSVNQNQSFTSEYHPYDPPAIASAEPDVSIKGEESFDPNDPTVGLFHPVPRPASLFIASRNMAMFPDAFADAKLEFDSTSLFTSPEASNECLFDDSVIRRPEWTIDDVETAPLFNELSPGRPIDTFVDTSLASMNDTCSPDSSLSWSSLGYEANPSMQQPQQQQALINHNETLCSDDPELFTPNDHYDHINAGYDPTATTANDFHGLNGLALLNSYNESHSHPYLPPPVPMNINMNLNPWRHEYTDLASTRNPMPLNRDHEPLFVPADIFAYRESLFRLDQLTRPHPRFPVETTHLRPQLLGKRTFNCPGETRNAFLIECKRRGLSYKDIKRLGGFKEAESTLRGKTAL
ncbi:uncharacterized protein LDX57_007623 [Aspergillus melleus]|uniref:uncharacterized protein n=1 Tax=Aspergillus melleus TaxID=138277 RepID=UPI001E8E1D33|nr:uncharacterized protein LDX57_007623 [Aspergillus melleus]KAH8429950.1 hypothetical protein LDX57_007623 [Aspergillus melleus]